MLVIFPFILLVVFVFVAFVVIVIGSVILDCFIRPQVPKPIVIVGSLGALEYGRGCSPIEKGAAIHVKFFDGIVAAAVIEC